jgi:FMN-dependent NADH-azoreductase
MATLLKIDVSPRGDYSVSRKLGTQFEGQWKTSNPDGKVITRDLAKTDLPFVTLPWIMGAYSDPAGHTPEQKHALQIGDEMIAELQEADQYLITTPMYNFNVPAILKAWIDHVIRAGKTFRANPDGSYTGLLTGKKATIIIASAGSYAPGTPAVTYNFERPYLTHVLGFLGITDVTFIEAGGTYVLNSGSKTVDQFVHPFADQVLIAAGR